MGGRLGGLRGVGRAFLRRSPSGDWCCAPGLPAFPARPCPGVSGSVRALRALRVGHTQRRAPRQQPLQEEADEAASVSAISVPVTSAAPLPVPSFSRASRGHWGCFCSPLDTVCRDVLSLRFIWGPHIWLESPGSILEARSPRRRSRRVPLQTLALSSPGRSACVCVSASGPIFNSSKEHCQEPWLSAAEAGQPPGRPGQPPRGSAKQPRPEPLAHIPRLRLVYKLITRLLRFPVRQSSLSFREAQQGILCKVMSFANEFGFGKAKSRTIL